MSIDTNEQGFEAFSSLTALSLVGAAAAFKSGSRRPAAAGHSIGLSSSLAMVRIPEFEIELELELHD